MLQVMMRNYLKRTFDDFYSSFCHLLVLQEVFCEVVPEVFGVGGFSVCALISHIDQMDIKPD